MNKTPEELKQMTLHELEEYCKENTDADACYDLAHRYLSVTTYMQEMLCDYLPDRRILLDNGCLYLHKALAYGHPKAQIELEEVCAEIKKLNEKE